MMKQDQQDLYADLVLILKLQTAVTQRLNALNL